MRATRRPWRLSRQFRASETHISAVRSILHPFPPPERLWAAMACRAHGCCASEMGRVGWMGFQVLTHGRYSELLRRGCARITGTGQHGTSIHCSQTHRGYTACRGFLEGSQSRRNKLKFLGLFDQKTFLLKYYIYWLLQTSTKMVDPAVVHLAHTHLLHR